MSYWQRDLMHNREDSIKLLFRIIRILTLPLISSMLRFWINSPFCRIEISQSLEPQQSACFKMRKKIYLGKPHKLKLITTKTNRLRAKQQEQKLANLHLSQKAASTIRKQNCLTKYHLVTTRACEIPYLKWHTNPAQRQKSPPVLKVKPRRNQTIQNLSAKINLKDRISTAR